MLSVHALDLDVPAEIARIAASIRQTVLERLRRRGVVLGLSGGIDSSVVAALAVRALGPDRVTGLLMPDVASADESLQLGQTMADAIGIRTIVEAIAPTLRAVGCYARQTEAIRRVMPDYAEGDAFKIVLPSILAADRLNVARLTVRDRTGTERTVRLSAEANLQLVAATNFKQRVRKMLEYYHADRLHYAVAGTPNRLEYDQGFFVKQGDGAADLKPIAHLYKSQVYALAAELGVPDDIRRRPPTTDTFPMPQTQEEFYFSLPYEKMDLCLFGYTHGVTAAEVAGAVGLTADQVERVFRDIAQKRRATRYLHGYPVLVDPIEEIQH
ncbi:MAG: NAD(+) synthase [Vicinamibacterales bacterium]|nr:NAD(+) synthase [Vicinamibacterales bacterium]